MQKIDINKTVNELVFIYLTEYKIPKNYDIENIENQKTLYIDFLDFIKETKFTLTENQFINECRWWWCLIPTGNEFKETNILPVFSYYNKPIKNIIPRANVNLLQLYEVIRNPKYFEKTTVELRKITDKTAKANYKQNNFDYVCFSGVFSQRNSISCTKPSGYLCIDIDHLQTDINELKNILIADENLDIQLLFVSPSGDGLKIVVCYDTTNKLNEIFEIIEIYFKKIYDIQIDKTGKNIDRACFICYDSEVFINNKILKK